MNTKWKTQLFCTAAVMLVASVAAYAQDGEAMETVVVTGQRAALASAITIKEKSDVVVDSVAAEDVGKLPDNSITEVLQRLPGVNITRISTGGTSESYLGEGTGISIRGLTSTVSLLNGRDSFSAANGRNLAWEDVPPELAQGVDVFKSLSANLPEGGFGGVVNLRTRQPFDFDGFTANLTVSGNYADNAKKGHVGGGGLISDRWDTKIGEIGLLVNVTYSDLTTQADGVQVLPYYPRVYNPTYTSSTTTSLPSLSDAGSTEAYIPGGISFNRRTDDRVRLGLYAAAQWRPSDDMLLSLTAFRSRYTMNSLTHSMSMDGSSVVSVPTPGSTNTFDQYGNLTSTTGLSSFMWGFSGIGLTSENSWGYEPIPYQFQTQYSHTVNTTSDISLAGEWHPTDNFSMNFALQYVNSGSNQHDYAATLYAFVSDYSLQLSSYGDSTLPKMSFDNSSVDLSNASNYGWLATMPHKLRNKGTEYAGYLDTIYTISDTGFFRTIKSGLKLTYREENDNETTWNYRELSPYYDSGEHKYLSDNTSYGESIDLSDMFGGKIGLPSSVYFPTVAAAKDVEALQSAYGTYEDEDEAEFKHGTMARLGEKTATGYVMATFANDDNFLAPLNGNFGVRVVAYRDHAAGFHWSPYLEDSALDSSSTLLLSSDTSPTFVEGGHSEVDVLPSVNIQFLPTDQLHIRLAFSQAVNRPTFAQMNPHGTVSGSYVGTYTSYFSGSWGNPNLKPEKADQFDLSLEYYFTTGGMAHFSAFHKRIHNYISTMQANETVTFNASVNSGDPSSSSYCTATTSGATCTVSASVTEYFNEDQTAKVQGFELGFTKYADFLPEPFNGLGVDFNYTYIDSQQPGSLAYDMKGTKIEGLPLIGMSKDTINASLMFDKGPLSMRLAYNWRSDFLVSTAAYQTSGTYNYVNDINYAGQQGTVIHYALPVYQYGVGTLDWNMTYNLTDDVSWTLEASNLTKSTTRLYMGEGERRVNRSWYVADTRYTTQLRFKF